MCQVGSNIDSTVAISSPKQSTRVEMSDRLALRLRVEAVEADSPGWLQTLCARSVSVVEEEGEKKIKLVCFGAGCDTATTQRVDSRQTQARDNLVVRHIPKCKHVHDTLDGRISNLVAAQQRTGSVSPAMRTLAERAPHTPRPNGINVAAGKRSRFIQRVYSSPVPANASASPAFPIAPPSLSIRRTDSARRTSDHRGHLAHQGQGA